MFTRETQEKGEYQLFIRLIFPSGRNFEESYDSKDGGSDPSWSPLENNMIAGLVFHAIN